MAQEFSNPIVLVTGGNGGLGQAIISALCKSAIPYTILLGAEALREGQLCATRIQSNHPTTTSTITALQLNLTSDDSITSIVTHITQTYTRLDILINNAGIARDVAVQNAHVNPREGWTQTLSVNLTSTALLTEACIPLLLKCSTNPRILFISSGTSSLSFTERMDTPAFRGINASPGKGWPKEKQKNPSMMYRCSKAGLNMLMREFARLLKEDGVRVWGVSPGFMRTGLTGLSEREMEAMGAVEPEMGGEFVREVVEGRWNAETGRVVSRTGVQDW